MFTSRREVSEVRDPGTGDAQGELVRLLGRGFGHEDRWRCDSAADLGGIWLQGGMILCHSRVDVRRPVIGA